MVEERDKLARDVAEIVAQSLKHNTTTEAATAAVAFARLENDFRHAENTLEELKETVYEKHDPVYLWTKDFIDSYRKIMTGLVGSAIIIGLGLIIQLYYLIKQSR